MNFNTPEFVLEFVSELVRQLHLCPYAMGRSGSIAHQFGRQKSSSSNDADLQTFQGSPDSLVVQFFDHSLDNVFINFPPYVIACDSI